MTVSPGSFEKFVETHVDDFVRVAHLITWDESEAEDLVQECLIRTAKRWSTISGMEHPGAYVRRVLVNLALDERRRQGRRRAELGRPFSDVGDERALAMLDRFGVRIELLEALGQLPRQQRTVLGLRYFLDLSEEQTAELLDCSVGTVKSSASRGLARLRAVMVSDTTVSEVQSHE